MKSDEYKNIPTRYWMNSRRPTLNPDTFSLCMSCFFENFRGNFFFKKMSRNFHPAVSCIIMTYSAGILVNLIERVCWQI
jgi:hypothetical protein